MESSPSSAPDVAAVAARLPPVRYFAPYDEEDQEEDPDPVQDPDSPQSPGELPHGFLPLVFPNPNRPPPDSNSAAHLKKILHNDEPTPPPEPEPAPAVRRRRPEDEEELYCVVDCDDPESVRRAHELQSKRYAVFALRHYNADPRNAVKYELVEATGSQGIVLDCGHMIGHVTFTARPTSTDDVPTAQAHHPRPFFAEVHQPDLVPACVISMDDGEEDDYELCEFCDHLEHPKVPPQLRAQMTRRIEREECDRVLSYQRKKGRP